MSYIDAKWEEPDLGTAVMPARRVRGPGLMAWLSRRVAAFVAWRLNRQAGAELALMSDRELRDIGLSRADVGRAIQPRFNGELCSGGRHH